jgi:hypothetical protein
MALLLEVCVAVTATMAAILFWMTYITRSEHLMLLLLTPPQVVGRKTLMVFLNVPMSQNIQNRKWALLSSVAYAVGSTAKQLLHGVNCDACKVRLMSQVMKSINVFIHFNEYCDTESHAPILGVLL